MNSQQPGIPGAADLRVSMMSSSMPFVARTGRGTSDASEGFSSFLDRYSGERGTDGSLQQYLVGRDAWTPEKWILKPK